jgi:putative nucleotidyltransferase with HDIG domain
MDQLTAHRSRVEVLSSRFGSPEVCNRLDEALEFAALEGMSVAEAIREFVGDLTALAAADFGRLAPLISVEASRLPVMPGAVSRLLRTSEEKITGWDLESIAGSDPVLAARLLSAANSVLFGSRLQISTLRDAILRVGVPEARKALLAGCMARLFAPKALQDLWKHSQAVADAAWEVAGLCGVDREMAYLAGLLHDIGRVGYSTYPAEFRGDEQSWIEEGFPLVYAESMAYGKDHAEFGAELLRDWDLPAEIADAVRYHHRPECSDSRLASVLCLAESLTGPEEDLWPDMRKRAAFLTVGIDQDQLDEIATLTRQRACA